jgi:serine/threonine protein kinase
MTAHNFQAPEVYVGSHVHGTSSEWFSAGITLHEFLTGRRPFEASKLQAFRYATANTLNNYSDSLRLEYMEQCDFLTPTCKEFVRELLMVDVRLSSKFHINFDYWYRLSRTSLDMVQKLSRFTMTVCHISCAGSFRAITKN